MTHIDNATTADLMPMTETELQEWAYSVRSTEIADLVRAAHYAGFNVYRIDEWTQLEDGIEDQMSFYEIRPIK